MGLAEEVIKDNADLILFLAKQWGKPENMR